MRYTGQIAAYLPATAPLALRVPESVYGQDPVGVTSTGPGISTPLSDYEPPSQQYEAMSGGGGGGGGGHHGGGHGWGGGPGWFGYPPSDSGVVIIEQPPQPACSCPKGKQALSGFPGIPATRVSYPPRVPSWVPAASPVPMGGFFSSLTSTEKVVGIGALIAAGLWFAHKKGMI